MLLLSKIGGTHASEFCIDAPGVDDLQEQFSSFQVNKAICIFYTVCMYVCMQDIQFQQFLYKQSYFKINC